MFVLYLDPRRQREGIGSRLLDALTEQQLAQGAREQWVSVELQNIKGLAFYRARGFETRGERPAWGTQPSEGRTSLRQARRLAWRVERDPERGRATAAKLRELGVKGILIQAAEQGYITQLACKMPECFCPEELGGACHFEPVTDELSDWMPTHEHFPRPKREGGHRTVDNAVLAHRLCNRIDYSISVGRWYASDLERVRKAREEAIRRSNSPHHGEPGRGHQHDSQRGVDHPGP